MSLCECGCGQKTSIIKKTSRAQGRVKGQPSRFVVGHAMQGKKKSPEAIERSRAAHLGVKRSEEAIRNMSGSRKSTWKGDDVSYCRLHSWVLRWKTKTGSCTRCGTTEATTEWANVSGEYRRDLNDFVEMCRSCHRTLDRRRGSRRAERFAS